MSGLEPTIRVRQHTFTVLSLYFRPRGPKGDNLLSDRGILAVVAATIPVTVVTPSLGTLVANGVGGLRQSNVWYGFSRVLSYMHQYLFQRIDY